MRTMVAMMRDIFAMPFPWNVWVQCLALVNLAGGLWFFGRPEGKAAVAAIMAAAVVMAMIYGRHGFVRLMGLGHILFWVPLLTWFAATLATSQPDGPFRTWLLAVVALNGVSLAIDLVDVARWLRGEREPILD